MANLFLTTTPHSYNFEHVIHLKNKENLFNYYKDRGGWLITNLNIPTDGNRSMIEVDIDVDHVARYDYCILYEGDKKYYYFILNITQKGYITVLNVVLDVWNTYIYDCKLNESFIERCHMPRWLKVYDGDGNMKVKPRINRVDEGIDYGPKIFLSDHSKIEQEYSKNFIVCTSTPIGKLLYSEGGGDDEGGEGGGDYEGTGTSWENGELSAKGFRFIKGYEGFGVNAYQDSEGFWTIAYGITKHAEPTIYNKLASQTPLTEEIGAKESYFCMNKNYGKIILPVCKELGISKQCQFDALVSFSMNLGVNILKNPKSDIYQALKSGNEQNIRSAFSLYVKAGGVTLPGLVSRRKQEANLFFGDKYEIRPITKIGGGTIPGDGWLPTENTTPSKKDFSLKGYDWVYPTTGVITSDMYRENGDYHGAIDIGCPIGTDVKATRGGTVKLADGTSDPNGYGNWIILEHEKEKLQSYYAHNSKLLVKVGDKVSQGQLIAKSGNTGRSTGPHLHYEVREYPYGKENKIKGIPGVQRGQKI